MKININNFLGSNFGHMATIAMKKVTAIKPQQLIVVVFDAVVEDLPGLEAGYTYTTEDLCGPTLWASWTTGTRRAAGMCMHYLVENNHLPLWLVMTSSGSELGFRLKDIVVNRR